jgi:hypothetical protein
LTDQASPLSGCTVSEAKIIDYLLNQSHLAGGPKAQFFLSSGFSPAQWREMAAALAEHPDRNPIAETIRSAYGTKYVVRCDLQTPDARNPCIVTVWMKDGDAPPKLVTAYPE